MSDVDVRRLWEAGSTEWLAAVGRAIEDGQVWQGNLTLQEHQVLDKALQNDQEWVDLVSCDGEFHSHVVNGDVVAESDKDDELDKFTMAFRTRCLIYEQAIETLFPPTQGCCTKPLNIEQVGQKFGSGGNNGMIESQPEPPLKVVRRIEDEDYDEATSSKEGSERNLEATGMLEHVYLLNNKEIQFDSHKAAMLFGSFIPTLEYDRSALLEQQELEVRLQLAMY
jgi:hypothetical protein